MDDSSADERSVDDGGRIIPRRGAMFTDSSLNKADLATNLAVQLLADGGWSALTLRNIAQAARVTPPAIAAWFPSSAVMRAAIAGRYGERWVRERGNQARHRIRPLVSTGEPVTLVEVALSLLPATRLEEVFAGVWLTILEAGRWDDAIAAQLAVVRERERDMVFDLLADVVCRDDVQREGYVDLVLVLTQRLDAALAAPHGALSAERAERAQRVVRACLSGVR